MLSDILHFDLSLFSELGLSDLGLSDLGLSDLGLAAHFQDLLAFGVGAAAFRAIILLAALAFDWMIGEPAFLWRRFPHPVVLFGRAIRAFDVRWNSKLGHNGRQRQCRGALAMALLALLGVAAGIGLSAAGPVAVFLILTILLAARSLDQHVRAVATSLDTNLREARHAVGMIVGRNTDEMDEGDIARAAIETGAENLSDGVFAPSLWFLMAGLPGVLVYKITNTADSMIGYRNARYRAFGSTAARFDDLLNLVPARITALLIVLAALFWGRFWPALRVMLTDARHHASPNAGWPESAMAGALGVWLAGPRRYGKRIRQARRFASDGSEADRIAIRRALKILIVAQILFAAAIALFAGMSGSN
jgi:adenosylcobinamide-phosphate synthase